MRSRSRERELLRGHLESLEALGDALRSGASLRQALIAAGSRTGSPFASVVRDINSGRPIAPALYEAATGGDDADTGATLCVLAVHAQTGGDPLPATRALADGLAARAAARDEARALTTQARLGARAVLLLTPAFLLLVSLSDPRGAVSMATDPRTRAAMLGGLVLQGLGAMWIGAIVGGVGNRRTWAARTPVVRALRALLAGRVRSTIDEDVAACAGASALALAAGVSPTAAVAAVAPFARGSFGAALRAALRDVAVPLDRALWARCRTLESEAADRFVAALSSARELGVPLAPAMLSLSDGVRQRASIRLAEDTRRASMRVLVPLGVLVLPAFVLACLVPLFVGGLRTIAR